MIRDKPSILLSLLSGILLGLPWLIPGTGIVLLFAFVPLIFAENRLMKTNLPGNYPLFGIYFFSFLLWNLLATWWIAWVSLGGMMLIVLANSLLMAGVWWLAGFVCKRFGKSTGYISLVAFWISYEFFLSHCDIPWPWLALGNGFSWSVKIVQWYEFTGAPGGSLWVLAANIFLFETIHSFRKRRLKHFVGWCISSLAIILVPVLLSLVIYFGYHENGSSIRILSVQPNVDPYTEKFGDLSQKDQLANIFRHTESHLSDSVDLVVAPETSLPDLWEDSLKISDPLSHQVFRLMDRYPKMNFLGGSLTNHKVSSNNKPSLAARKSGDGKYFYDVYNSAIFFGFNHEIQINHKNLLVNGVERMPFQKYFSFLNQNNLDLGGTSGSLVPGDSPVIFSMGDSVKIGSVICFESAFGEYTAKVTREGAGLLAVITNDGWWKRSAGVWQHFGYSRIRAIENRRSIVRSANTGISGFINQRGDVLDQTTINEQTAILSTLKANTRLTFYTIYGDYLGRIFIVLSGLILIYFVVFLIYLSRY